MSEQSTQSATWSFAIALAAVGGFLAAVGVLLPWASATVVQTTEIFGDELVGTHSANGSGDIAGVIVLVAGLVIGVLGVLALLVKEEGFRRTVGVLALVGGLVILAACVLGVLRPQDVLGDLPVELSAPEVAVETTVAAGVFVSAAGGLIAAAGGAVARRTPART